MKTFDPVEFGRRLTQEVDRLGWDLKRFQEEIHARTGGARGSSYGQVWSYVRGKAGDTPPRESIVDAMAKIAGVRQDYLLFGGPRTTYDEAAASHAGPGADPFGEALGAAGKVLREAFPLADAAAHSQLWRLWAAVTNREAIRAGSTVRTSFQVDTERADPVACAEVVVRAVTGPLDQLNLFGGRAKEGTQPLDSYIIAACEVLWTALAHEEPRLSAGRRVLVPKQEGD